MHETPQLNSNARAGRVWLKAAIVVMLLAVAGLSTLAKNTQYLPKSSPTHYVNIASKMTVPIPPAALKLNPLHVVAKLIVVRPVFTAREFEEMEAPPIPQIGVVVSLQHRSPPRYLA